MGTSERIAVGCRVGEKRLFLLERGFLLDVVDGGDRDLVHLEAEEIDFAGAGPLIATE